MKIKIASGSILSIGISLTILLSWLMFQYELVEIKEKFADQTRVSTAVVEQNLKNIAIANDRLSFLFQVNEDVLDEDFREHSRAVLSQLPYIDKIIYASKIRNSHRQTEQEKLRYEGYTGFQFRQFSGSQGAPTPFSAVIFPIKYIQPYNPLSSTWFGKDLMTLKPAQEILHDVISNGRKMQFAFFEEGHSNNEVYLFSSVTFLNENSPNKITMDDVFGVLGYQLDIDKLLSDIRNNSNLVANVSLKERLVYKAKNIRESQFLDVQRSEAFNFEGQKVVISYQLPQPWTYIDYRIPLLIFFLGGLVTAFAFFVVKNHLERHKMLNEQKLLIEKKVKEKTKLLETQAQQITKAYNHQLSISRELESFSYSISHDLRAPLRSISGFANVLVEDYSEQLTPEARDMLTRVETGAKKMSNLIDDLLDLSRISRQSLKQEQFSMSDLVKETIEDLRGRFPQCSFEVSIMQNLVAEGDRNLIQIALTNLLSNAIKYSAKSNHAKIEFGMFLKDNKPVYFIKDNGVGFNMDYANKLFVAFQRLHGSEFEGTGIGLAIVQRIINRHGGKIWAESEINKGTTFYFMLG